jgi:hypothetical protein
MCMSYVPPDRHATSGQLLSKERERVEKHMAIRREAVVKLTGTDIVSDGATNVKTADTEPFRSLCWLRRVRAKQGLQWVREGRGVHRGFPDDLHFGVTRTVLCRSGIKYCYVCI